MTTQQGAMPPQFPQPPSGINPQDTATLKLLNRQTSLPGPELKSLLHRGEIPFLIVAAVLYVGAIIIALVNLGTWLADVNSESINNPSSIGLVEQMIGIVVFAPILVVFARGLMYAQMRASGVRMSPTQFPEGYKMLVEASLSAGLRRIPDAYVVGGNGTINAFASGHGWRRFVVVYSDLFEVGGKARDPEALRFVIAHEVGHLAAGHVSYFRLVMIQALQQVPLLGLFLSRAQEYTADNFGYRLTGLRGAEGAIKVLAAGKYLNANVDFNEFADRSLTEKGFFLWIANLTTTHPILLWRAQALRDRSRPGSLFLRPKAPMMVVPSLPPASTPTAPSAPTPVAPGFATPQEAAAFIETYPPTGSPQFGAVFPTPLPGDEIRKPAPGSYGVRMLAHRWQQTQTGGPGFPGGPQGGGFPGAPQGPQGGFPQGGGFPGAPQAPQGGGFQGAPQAPQGGFGQANFGQPAPAQPAAPAWDAQKPWNTQAHEAPASATSASHEVNAPAQQSWETSAPQSATEAPAQQAWETSAPQSASEAPAQQAWETSAPQSASEAPAHQTWEAPQQTWETPAQQTWETPAQQTWETPAQQTWETPAQQTWETPQQSWGETSSWNADEDTGDATRLTPQVQAELQPDTPAETPTETPQPEQGAGWGEQPEQRQ